MHRTDRRPRKSLRCRVGWHRWKQADNGEGATYLTCRDCGRDEDPGGRTHGLGTR